MSKKETYAKSAKKNKANKNTVVAQEEKVKKEDSIKYTNPAKTNVGKIIIIVLAVLMAFSGLFTLFWVIFNR